MRGEHTQTIEVGAVSAGSTLGPATPGAGVGDHPRMRGEHNVVPPLACPFCGSPPHARGAP